MHRPLRLSPAAPLWGLALALATGVGCAAQLPMPTQTDVLRASATWPGTTLADLHDGRRLYVSHCGGCHTLYRPNEYPAAKWPALVEEMAEDTKLAKAELEAIVRYLATTAAAPAPTKQATQASHSSIDRPRVGVR